MCSHERIAVGAGTGIAQFLTLALCWQMGMSTACHLAMRGAAKNLRVAVVERDASYRQAKPAFARTMRVAARMT